MTGLNCQLGFAAMRDCPCCSYPLLQYVGRQKLYCFCRRCWQEMPQVMEINCERTSLLEMAICQQGSD